MLVAQPHHYLSYVLEKTTKQYEQWYLIDDSRIYNFKSFDDVVSNMERDS